VKPGMPVWRRDDRGGPHALIITKLGRASLNADEVDEASSAGARSTKPRDRKARSPNTATATKPGLSRDGDSAKPRWNDLDEMDTGATSADQTSPEAPRPGSKLAAVIALLQGEAGSSIEELSAVTGWLPHTTRAALTGLRKRGYVVERLRLDEGGSTYRIVKLTSPIAA
jgi:Protein of unknown function (DUF3489)